MHVICGSEAAKRLGSLGRGCAEGKAAPGAGLEGAPIESFKKKYRITVLWNKVGVFLGKIVVH